MWPHPPERKATHSMLCERRNHLWRPTRHQGRRHHIRSAGGADHKPGRPTTIPLQSQLVFLRIIPSPRITPVKRPNSSANIETTRGPLTEAAFDVLVKTLSARQMVAFMLRARGYSNEESAGQMRIRRKTVESYHEHIKRKLGVSSRNYTAAAVSWGRRHLPSTPITPHPPIPPTRRQMEVGRLYAAGKTRATIADHLGLSARTVDSHITTLRTKLGIVSRRDLYLSSLLSPDDRTTEALPEQPEATATAVDHRTKRR